MKLSVITKHGRPFRRAGLLFGAAPVIVDGNTPGGDATIKALRAEPMLICTEVKDGPAEPDAPKPGDNGRKK